MSYGLVAGQGTGYSEGHGIAVDGAGNAYITGHFSGTVDFDPGIGVVQLTSTGGTNHFVVKYGPSGDLLWVRDADSSTSSEFGRAIAVDGAGNSYVTGNFSGTVDFDPGAGTVLSISTGGLNHFVAKYDPAGDLVWVKDAGSSTNYEIGQGIAVDEAGNSYVTGYYLGTVEFGPGAGVAQRISTGAANHFVAKYDSSGNLLWVQDADSSTSAEVGQAIAVDNAGNSYVTGYYFGTVDFSPGAGVAQRVSTGANHFVAKYDSSGDLLWVQDADSSTGWEAGQAIAIDEAGNSYVTGYFDGTVDFDPGVGVVQLISTPGSSDHFVAKYDSTGDLLWARNAGGSSDYEYGHGIVVDGAHQSYVTGYFYGTVDFDLGVGVAQLVSNPGQHDHFVAKYDALGNLLWVKNAGSSTGSEGAYGIDVDSSGNAYATGSFFGSADFDPDIGTVIAFDGGSTKHFIAAYTPSGQLRGTDTIPPAISAPDLDVASDSGSSLLDDLTSDTTPTFTGTGEDGAAVVLIEGADTLGAATVSGGIWSISTSALGEGPHTVFARAFDEAGNSADSSTLAIIIDTTPPAISAPDLDAASDSGTSSLDDLTNVTTPTFTGTGEDGAVVTLMEGDDSLGAATVSGGTWSIASDVLGQGAHTIRAHATDAAGNSADSDTLVVTVDMTAPTTSVLSAPSGIETIDSADFTFSSDDSLASFEADLDAAGFGAVANPLALAGLDEGPHTLVVRARDAAGNVDLSPETVHWSIDGLPPDTTILSGPSGSTSQTGASFDFGSTEDGVVYEANRDGIGYAPVTDPLILSDLGEGPHTLLVRAIDAAGNADATPASRTWTIDLTPPAAPVIAGFSDDTGELGDGVTTDRTLTLGGTAEALGIVQVLRDGVPAGTATADAGGHWSWGDADTLSFGAHSYTAYAEDAAGNESGTSDALAVIVADGKGNPGNGGDAIAGGPGAGIIDGKNGDDTIFGEGGNDTLKGGNGNDQLSGDGDRDALWGGNGNDSAAGGGGNDTLYGEAGNDALQGGDGNDRMEGGAGSDALDGGAGADTLHGGADADTLTAGLGADRLYGDAMGDWIVLGDDGAKDSVYGTVAHLADDTILGFDSGMGGDVIALTGLASKYGKLLDGIEIAGGILSLSKLGGGTITFDGLEGTHHTDTMLGSDGSILVYVM